MTRQAADGGELQTLVGEGKSSSDRSSTPHFPVPAALTLLSVLQVALLLLIPSSIEAKLIAAALGLASCNIAIAHISDRQRQTALALITLPIFANVAFHTAQGSSTSSVRLMLVAVLAGYGAIALAALTATVSKISPKQAMSVAALLFGLLLASEALIDRLKPHFEAEWEGGTTPHTILGDSYKPYTTARTLYPSNPRGYFDENKPSAWSLETHHEGSRAELTQDSRSGSFDLDIASAAVPTPWHIQVNRSGFPVKANTPYVLSFRVRADGPRVISYGLSMGHPPWEGLGFYREVAVGSHWQEISDRLLLSADDPNARLHFDLGADSVNVEIGRPLLRIASSGRVISPPSSSTEFSVSYRFNSLGCRGRDYAPSSEPGRKRILILGDSNALGEGVHEVDTIAARMESNASKSSAEPAAAPVEVINCAVRGYSTREQRLFFEEVGSHYRPDLVLVLMSEDDDISRGEALRLGDEHAPSNVEGVFHTVRWLRTILNEGRRPVDFTGSMDELGRLAEACRAHEAQLAVILFRAEPSTARWTILLDAVSKRLEDEGVPWLDLGPALLTEHTAEDLAVYRGDPHPNDQAHRIAAVEIAEFLRSRGLT